MVSSTALVAAVAIVCFCNTHARLGKDSDSLINGLESRREKRDLPIVRTCDPRSTASASTKCYKADLIDTGIADCQRDASLTCTPIDNRVASRVVDVADTSGYGTDCQPVSGLPIQCGTQDTRCVCNKPAIILFNSCRCQYWPASDVRAPNPGFCTQHDHGGTSEVHFFACCNNCNDPGDRTCNGRTYQGGGSSGQYCASCGQAVAQYAGRETYHFNCGGCGEQSACEKRCDEIRPYSKRYPGLCWKWSNCFRGCCIGLNPSFRGKRAVDGVPESFCGDTKCEGEENRYNCPGDCCSVANPDVCSKTDCAPICCAESNCCVNGMATPSSSGHSPTLSVLFYLVVSAAAVTMWYTI